ncbi:hypothetical protein F5B20DRAFT_590988 [Whalleya microplaca]|nr:hypothetical protein F5B20DRAFT_590988 [Whalleya microplaca]
MDDHDELRTHSPNEDPPPPYSQSSNPPGPGTTSSSATQPQKPQIQHQLLPRASVHTTPLFPLSWNLYRSQSLGRVLMLGAQETGPLYAVSQHSGWSGKPHMILHSGPSDTLPALAAGIRPATLGEAQHSIIILPPLPGSSLDSSQELFRAHAGRPRVTFRFTVVVGTEPSSWRRETFEWRHSYGDAVASLDGARDGWKLVRSAGVSSVSPSNTSSPVSATSSDGHELVAVWAYARFSLSKAMKFRFLGSGETGALGDRWAIMAVMTALRMFQWQNTSS